MVKKGSSEPKIPRRKNLRITKRETKEMALELVADAIGGTFAESMLSAFKVRMMSEWKRTPSIGEQDVFLEEITRIVKNLRRRVTRKAN